MPPAIETKELTKAFDDVVALDHLSLRVEPGEIVGFLGPNGAGKSTAIRLLLDLIRPTSGRASVFGHDCQRNPEEVRAAIGYLPGDLRLYPSLTGAQTAKLIANLRPRPIDASRAEGLAHRLQLDLNRRAGTLSRGNRQKLGWLLALLDRPPLLVLDEPTAGLDPLMQHVVWELLREEAAAGGAVFLSSHVMSEVEQICDRVAILREGKLIAVEPVDVLKARSFRSVEVRFAEQAPPPAASAIEGVREQRRDGLTVWFELAGEADALVKAIADYHVVELKTHEPSLDEIVLRYYEAAGK